MKGKTAVITGAGSGFGRLTAVTLANAGWCVYATMRNASDPNVVRRAGFESEKIHLVDLDITLDASVDAAAATIHADAGAIDVLINNAGTAFYGVLEAFTPEAIQHQFMTNVFGPMRVNRAFLPAMRARKHGLIIYLTSILGRRVVPFSGPYTASKWALEALAEMSSYELAPFGIDVAIVEPDSFPTEINLNVTGADDPARLTEYGDSERNEALVALLHKMSEGRNPQQVADAIVRLANLPRGAKPLRTTVPANASVDEANATTATMQRQLLTAFGLSDLL